MTTSTAHSTTSDRSATADRSVPSFERAPDRELQRWGGVAGVAGAAAMIGAGVVVGSLGLPDASDVETLTDFSNIESGRIAEHFLYLAALMLLALHILVVHRLVRADHPAASLFGTATAQFGLVIMAASSLLHVATSPLADLYTSPDTPAEDLPAIEYAWHAGQSVFDTMLTTGVLLVPIGLALLGVAMLAGSVFSRPTGWIAIVLCAVGTAGAVIAVIDPGSMFSALSVMTIFLFGLLSGWRMLRLGNPRVIDLSDRTPMPGL